MQVLANGIVSGLVLALLSTAFALVFVPTRVFHVALGGSYTIAPYIMYSCLNSGIDPILGISLSLLVGTGWSFLCEACNHRFLEKRNSSIEIHLLSSLGLYIVLVQVVSLIWGDESQYLRQGIDSSWSFLGMFLSKSQIVAGGSALLVMIFFHLWLSRTNLGLHFRALSDNPVETGLKGYNVNRLRLLAFSLSGLLGASASLAMAYDVGFDPNSGLMMVLLAVVAVIIGGVGSFWGPLLGAIFIGLLREEVIMVFSQRWQDSATFLILAVFLILRPQGILGGRHRSESEL